MVLCCVVCDETSTHFISLILIYHSSFLYIDIFTFMILLIFYIFDMFQLPSWQHSRQFPLMVYSVIDDLHMHRAMSDGTYKVIIIIICGLPRARQEERPAAAGHIEVEILLNVSVSGSGHAY